MVRQRRTLALHAGFWFVGFFRLENLWGVKHVGSACVLRMDNAARVVRSPIRLLAASGGD